jgi:hypothetical protein
MKLENVMRMKMVVIRTWFIAEIKRYELQSTGDERKRAQSQGDTALPLAQGLWKERTCRYR